MFSNASVYDSTNGVQKKSAEIVLEKLLHLLTWKEGERILDVGCGSGNVTTQILAPKLPADFKLLVGCDISKSMVIHANANYKDPRTAFLEASIDEPDFRKLKKNFDSEGIVTGFDKIFSFSCLHWTKDYSVSARNLYSLLQPKGQMLIVFVARSIIIRVWNEVAFSEKWFPYTKVAEYHKLQYEDSRDIDKDITQLMERAGFEIQACIHYDEYCDFSRPEGRVLMESANPFLNYIPEELRSDYIEDAVQTAWRHQEQSFERGLPFTSVAVVASKPEQRSLSK